jgi:hypothetical protein
MTCITYHFLMAFCTAVCAIPIFAQDHKPVAPFSAEATSAIL